MSDEVEALIEQLKPQVKSILKEIDSGSDVDRLRVLTKAQKHDFYYRGIQDVEPSVGVDGTISFAPVNEDTGDQDYRQRRVNKVRGDGKKFISVLGQKPPNIKAMPSDPRNENDRSAQRQADLGAAKLRVDWDVEVANMRLARGLWTAGTQFGYVRIVADGERNGYYEIPVMQPVEKPISPPGYKCWNCGAEFPSTEAIVDEITTSPLCPRCGSPLTQEDEVPAETIIIPEQVDVKRYPRSKVVLSIANITRVRVPFWAETLHDAEYLVYEYEESKSRLCAAYPGLRENLKRQDEDNVSTTTQSAMRVRTSAQSPSGTVLKNPLRLTYTRIWLRPSMYEIIEEEDKRSSLYERFPSGLKVTLVDGKIIALDEETIDDHWSYCPSETSDTIYTDAVCLDMIDVQDAMNDALTIGMETFLRGLPLTIISPDIIDPNTLQNRPTGPADMVVAKKGSGSRLEDGVVTVKTAQFPDNFSPFVQMFQSEAREATGVRPEIFGGGDGTQTATEFSKRQSQALAQLGMQWLYMRRFWVRSFTNGVKLLGDLGTEDLVAPSVGKNGSRAVESIDIAALRSGNFVFESDEAIPQSWGQQREQLLFLLGQAPQAAQALELFSPVNIVATRELLGIPNLSNHGEDMRAKVFEVISQLVNEQAVEDPSTGEMMPTIMPDDFADDLAVIVDVTKSWLNGDTGRKEYLRNRPGWENVKAYGKAAARMMQPPPEAQPQQQQEQQAA